MAASLAAAQRDSGRIAATLRRRGGAGSVDLVFDAVVVTTGPAHGSALGLNPVLSSLAARGLARADAAGLGVDVDAHSRMVGQSGVARPDLLVAGPLARGRFGELMGLPQVSQHAKAVAATAVAFIGELAAIR